MRNILAVALGGLIGTGLRLACDLAFPHADHEFPVETLLVNLAGAFVLGTLAGGLWRRPSTPGWVKAGIGSGVLGSFTTLSAVMASLVVLEREGEHLTAAIYLVVRNGAEPDTITAIDTPDLGPASMHESKATAGGSMSMLPVERIPVAAGAAVRFAPGGFHGMVGPLTRVIRRGDTLPLVVRFARGAAISVTARVITYADVDTATSAR